MASGTITQILWALAFPGLVEKNTELGVSQNWLQMWILPLFLSGS